jgi:uncharacterized membrane protein HdeD (DUF308 family)
MLHVCNEGYLKHGRPIDFSGSPGWVWMLLSGIVAIAVGVLLIANLPSSAAWAIGLLVGINLIMSGFAYLFLPMAAGAKT